MAAVPMDRKVIGSKIVNTYGYRTADVQADGKILGLPTGKEYEGSQAINLETGKGLKVNIDGEWVDTWV